MVPVGSAEDTLKVKKARLLTIKKTGLLTTNLDVLQTQRRELRDARGCARGLASRGDCACKKMCEACEASLRFSGSDAHAK